MTQLIEIHPDSADLYFTRGQLHLQHQQYLEALSDLNKTDSLQYPHLTLLDLTYAKTHYQLQAFPLALDCVDKILKRDDQHVNAYNLKGEILMEMSQYESAAASFLSVIQLANQSLPINYLNASFCYEQMEDTLAQEKAFAILHMGLEELGPLLTFYDRLVELSISTGQFGRAIEYQNQIIALSTRKEKSLFKRGMLYLLMDESTMAQNSFKAAKQSLLSLPLRIQKNKAMHNLLLKIDGNLDKLK